MHTTPLRRLAAAMMSSGLGMVLLATPASSSAPSPGAPPPGEPPSGEVTPAALTDPAFSYTRPAEYAVAEEDVRVPVRDGSWVACQLYRPADPVSSQPAPGTFPGIVYEYTAYADNAKAFGEGAGYFVRRGYNALVCQARGSGESPGELDPFSPQEQRDNYDVIEWLADHPASTGDIGQMGLSYGGHSTLLAAVNRPPHLRAIIPINGFHDWYEDTIYHGGIYSARIRGWQAAVAPETLTTYAEHPLYDDFWRGRSVMSRWENLTVPTLEINGWYDRYRDGMVKNYLAQPDNVWLVSGPWEHGYPEGQHAGIGPGVYLAWWDRWLAGDEDAPLPRSRVTSYEIPGPGAGAGWQQFRQWPPADAHRATLKLRSDGALGRASGPAGVDTFEVNTETDPSKRSERLLFTTAPQRRDVVLAGSGEARVRAAFSAGDGNIAAILYDQAPDGSMVRVTEGWLKASHRRGHRSLTPVEPGTFHTLDVHIRPTHYRLEQGHRLVLRLSSDDYPAIDSDAPAGRVRVAVGARGSSLTITVRGRSAAGR